MPPATDQCCVVSANPLFDFSLAVLESINCDLDYLSPPPSPISFLTPSDALGDESPLTTPEPSPASSPSNFSTTIPPLLLDGPPLVALPTPSPPHPNPMRSCVEAHCHTEKKVSKTPEHRRGRLNAAKKAQKKKKRERKRDTINGHYQARSNARRKHVESADSIQCSWDASDAAVASTSFVALDDGCGSKKEYELEELIGERSKFKFRRIEWNGSTPTAIVDSRNRLVGVLAGHPDDDRWPLLHSQGAEALEAARKHCYIPKTRRKHRRGAFVALNCGVSHGGGQSKPGNLKHCSPNSEILEELNELEPFKRIAGFSSSVMATWNPGLHAYYSRTIDELHSHDPSLKRIFSSCVYCGATYNLGPRTACCRHKDRGNLAFGSCSVTALGEFDPKRSGHLILWELHLVIEFPPGSTIIIPSAIVAHSNVKVSKHERRYSFALYTAGALFRWVENNCMTKENYLSSLSLEELDNEKAKDVARWKHGLSLMPTYTASEKKGL